MVESVPKNLTYGGYHYQPSQQEAVDLTHVRRDTPGGEYLRRFWHPVAMAEEIARDTPVALRILGEDLVLFRDKSGAVGLLHRHCSHRGTSLEYGIIEEHGIRCCYHGWKFDVDGRILDTPGEPATSRLKHSLCHGAYPTHEWGGLIFAYMGPPEAKPVFPMYDSFHWPDGNQVRPYKLHFGCNWLQVHENGADPIHTAFLHAIVSKVQFTNLFTAVPVIDFFETPIGFLSVATRRWKDMMYIRASDSILPNAAQFGTSFVTGEEEKVAMCAQLTRWITPIDNDSCWTIGVRHLNDVIDPHGESRLDLIGLGKVDFMGQTADRPYVDRQRNPGDHDAQVSQRPIAVHATENLAATDKGVALLRRLIRRGIAHVQDGEIPARPQRYDEGKTVPTYSIELVIRVPSQANLAEEELVRRFGKRVSEIVIETAELAPSERQRAVDQRIRHLIAHDLVA
jgi:nitrite reductase/ring-hydroxylating ferredoxin subunit